MKNKGKIKYFSALALAVLLALPGAAFGGVGKTADTGNPASQTFSNIHQNTVQVTVVSSINVSVNVKSVVAEVQAAPVTGACKNISDSVNLNVQNGALINLNQPSSCFVLVNNIPRSLPQIAVAASAPIQVKISVVTAGAQLSAVWQQSANKIPEAVALSVYTPSVLKYSDFIRHVLPGQTLKGPEFSLNKYILAVIELSEIMRC